MTRFADREPHFDKCPDEEDWTKVEKMCSILEVFWVATYIIFESDYTTPNLFLNEVSRVKVVLDKRSLDTDDFFKDMVKIKFDKYREKSNLLMFVAAVLDPRCKMRALEFCFPKLYSSELAQKEISHVRQPLQDLYSKYVVMYLEGDSSIEMLRGSYQSPHCNTSESSCGWSEYVDFLRPVELVQPQKLELDIYLEENCYLSDNRRDFNVLE